MGLRGGRGGGEGKGRRGGGVEFAKGTEVGQVQDGESEGCLVC